RSVSGRRVWWSPPVRPSRSAREHSALRLRAVSAAVFAAALGTSSLPAQTPPQTTPPPVPVPIPAAPAAPKTSAPPSIGIRVVGYQTVTPDTMAHYLGIKVGDPYDPEKIRGNFQTLWDVGLLENVTIEAETAPAGVTLVVTIEERPMISAIEYQGNKKISVSQIKDRLKEQKVDVKAGAPPSLPATPKLPSRIPTPSTAHGLPIP